MSARGDLQDIFARTEKELNALRTAILANDLRAVQGHTSRIAELLVRLRAQLQSSAVNPRTNSRSLHDLARDVLVLVQKSRRTVYALSAMYHLLLNDEPDAAWEPR